MVSDWTKQWMGEPRNVQESDGTVSFAAPAKTDFFRDPASDGAIGNAPLYYRAAPGELTFSVRVAPEFTSRYDAGAILCYLDAETWVKLAYEYTDMGYPAIVSVVTRERSDDCNGEPMDAGGVWLEASRKDTLLGLYYSLDGQAWKMHRLLSIPGGPERSWIIGISAQSPTGDGCRVRFSDFSWSETAVTDFRKG